MGRDIHYCIERQDADDSWHSVMSKPRAYQIRKAPENFGLTKEQPSLPIHLGYRDYERFQILSFFDEESEDGQDDKIANDDLPWDASAHAAELLDTVSDLHSHGHFCLGELRDLVNRKNGNVFPTEEKLAQGRELLADLDAIAADPVLLGEILTGPAYGENGQHYPEMESSNHARMIRIEQAKALLPIADNTLRILIAYDN